MVTLETHQSQELQVPALDQVSGLDQVLNSGLGLVSGFDAGLDSEQNQDSGPNAITVLTLLDKLVLMLDSVQKDQHNMEVHQVQMEAVVRGIQADMTKLSKSHSHTANTVSKLLDKSRKLSVTMKEVSDTMMKVNVTMKEVSVTMKEVSDTMMKVNVTMKEDQTEIPASVFVKDSPPFPRDDITEEGEGLETGGAGLHTIDLSSDEEVGLEAEPEEDWSQDLDLELELGPTRAEKLKRSSLKKVDSLRKAFSKQNFEKKMTKIGTKLVSAEQKLKIKSPVFGLKKSQASAEVSEMFDVPEEIQEEVHQVQEEVPQVQEEVPQVHEEVPQVSAEALPQTEAVSVGYQDQDQLNPEGTRAEQTMGFGDLRSASGLKVLNEFLSDKSYIEGFVPSQSDVCVFEALSAAPPADLCHALRWYKHISSYSDKTSLPGVQKPLGQYGPVGVADSTNTTPKAPPANEEEEDDDDLDLFGSDEEDEEMTRLKEERVAAYAAKKSKKPGPHRNDPVNLNWDVKPWDDETDMKKMEECVRRLLMDGLVWGQAKLVPGGYGIKKLGRSTGWWRTTGGVAMCCVCRWAHILECVVCNCVVLQVGTDLLEEHITAFEDLVQSVDVAAFNKI
uniref:Elongation factor 1-beta n=1 Tax=Knipowitschia caucasica TaxID=637954 RepID=A0AAV2L6G9_KNICA